MVWFLSDLKAFCGQEEVRKEKNFTRTPGRAASSGGGAGGRQECRSLPLSAGKVGGGLSA